MAITTGMQGQASLTVDQSHTARASGVGTLPTLGTSALIALLERAAVNAIRRGLDEGQESVGTMVSVRQLSPTGLGKHVRAEAVVTSFDGNRVGFDVVALDSHGRVGE